MTAPPRESANPASGEATRAKSAERTQPQHRGGKPSTNKKAPGDCANSPGSESQNPTRKEENQTMRKVSRKQRAANAQKGTVAADSRIIIRDEPADRKKVTYSDEAPDSAYVSLAGVFTSEELETMPVVVVNSSTHRVVVWRGPDGTWYRRGAWLRLQPRKDGEGSTFKIVLCKGSNRDDLDQMLRVVQATREGRLNSRWEKKSADWAPWADDRTYVYAFHSRTYADPYTHRDPSPDVAACSDAQCADRWHVGEALHRVDGVTRTLPDKRGHYTVEVTRCDDEDWQVDVFTDEFFGTPEDVAGFVNELQWMSEECRRANMARSAEKVAA